MLLYLKRYEKRGFNCCFCILSAMPYKTYITVLSHQCHHIYKTVMNVTQFY